MQTTICSRNLQDIRTKSSNKSVAIYLNTTVRKQLLIIPSFNNFFHVLQLQEFYHFIISVVNKFLKFIDSSYFLLKQYCACIDNWIYLLKVITHSIHFNFILSLHRFELLECCGLVFSLCLVHLTLT